MSTAQLIASPLPHGFTPYRWSWRYFQLGLHDYLRERIRGKVNPSTLPSTPSRVLRQMFGILAILVVISVLAGALAPPLANALGSAGVPLLTLIGGALVALAGFALMFAFPAYLGIKGYRFAHRMACRGWLIEQTARVAIPSSVL